MTKPASVSDEAPAAAVRPWSSRIFLLIGVVLLGLSLRHAVTVVPPLLSTIDAEIGLGSVTATLLGMLPTIAFGRPIVNLNEQESRLDG